MGWLLLGIFLLYGWIEFEMFFIVGEAIGGLATFLGLFVTAMIGISLLRSQSGQVMAAMRADAAKGRLGVEHIASSLSILLGAVLMLLPGYATDAAGLLCFIPGLRSLIGVLFIRHIFTRMQGRFTNGMFSFGQRGQQGQTGQHQNPFSAHPHHYTDKEGYPPADSLDGDVIEGDFAEKSNFDKDSKD